MTNRVRSLSLAGSAFFCAVAAQAQQPEPRIDYEAGEYQYPSGDERAEEGHEEADGPAAAATLPASRSIVTRQRGPAPLFVSRPVLQPIDVQEPAEVAEPFDGAQPNAMAATQVVVVPNSAAAGGAPMAYQQYQLLPQANIRPGSRVVGFDTGMWLSDCRERLSGYHPADREAVMAALGGPAPSDLGQDHCQSYLDWYLDRESVPGAIRFEPLRQQQVQILVIDPAQRP